MKELHAGYVCGALWTDIQEGSLSADLDWLDVVNRLSHFVVDREFPIKGEPDPIVSVLANLLGRGLPTVASLYVERRLERLAGITCITKSGNTEVSKYESTFKTDDRVALTTLLERALCAVSVDAIPSETPGFGFLEIDAEDGATAFDSQAEREFWNGPLYRLIGAGGMQLALRQRPFETISGMAFQRQKVDVAVQFPGTLSCGPCVGIVFEVDGPQHASTVAKDQQRDNAAMAAGWAKTYRHQLWKGVDAGELIDPNDAGVQLALAHPYLHRVQQNIASPLQKDSLGSQARLVALLPFAVARIQMVILQLILTQELSLDQSVWNIVLINRDNLPGVGVTAARDLRLWMRCLWGIYAPGRVLPNIRIHDIQRGGQVPLVSGKVDFVLDVSVEMRYGVTQQPWELPEYACNAPAIVIRSGYYRRQMKRELVFGAPLAAVSKGESLLKALTFVLRNVFRKVDFRPKQVEIIARALRNESVIALLPTGAGKSITYQIPALLQNGIVIVVDPIKSLMKDQDDNLKAIGISASAFINSMTSSKERRVNTQDMQDGLFKFVFVSPERFIIREFREALKNMRAKGRVYCAYVVVDEAHCVSEWGHDFRTAYLRLGANARRFCPFRVSSLPLLALTGTASYEVLDDIQIELGHQRGGADISVRPDSMERKNLNYQVVQLNPTPQVSRSATDYSVKLTVGNAKLSFLPSLMESLVNTLGYASFVQFMSEKDGSGLVFCPHARWVHGAEFVHTALSGIENIISKKIGIYHGSPEDDGNGASSFDPIQTQDDFKRGVLKILACTKAFGMGIDKSDVRFTLHYNIPPSLESFYQEAGRAGRDGGQAQCWILLSGLRHPADGMSVDYAINHSFHEKTFPGPAIEEEKLIEILNQNRVPGRSPVTQLSEMLFDDTGIDYYANVYHPGNSNVYRIYINHPAKNSVRVYIDVPHQGQLTTHIQVGFDGDQKILDLVKDWLEKTRPAVASWRDWIFSAPGLSVEPGLEELLEQTIPGQGATPVVVFFENGYLEEIADQLQLDLYDVRKVFQFSSDPSSFSLGIAKKVPGSVLEADWINWLESVFPLVRLREHTFRAVYRLSLLGAVEDFEADYAGGCLTISLCGQEPGSYTKALERYIESYAPMDVLYYLDIAAKYEQPTELRRCLHALMAFVYARIAKQRVEALNIMEQTSLRGVGNPEEFKEAVTYFFDSSYLPVLRPQINNYSVELVFEVCESTAGSGAKLSHLLGACNRLLPENPDNGAFHAMRAVAMIFKNYPDGEIIDEVQAAVDCFKRYWKWGRSESLDFIIRLGEQLRGMSCDRVELIDAMLINDHADWVHQYLARHSEANKRIETT